MADRIKVNFLGEGKPNELLIIHALTEAAPVSIRDLYIAQSYAIVSFNNAEDVNKLYSEEAQIKLATHNLKVAKNNKGTAVFVSGVRPFIANFSPEELVDDINATNCITCKFVFFVKNKDYKPGNPLSLKLILDSKDDADYVLENGVSILKMDYKKCPSSYFGFRKRS